MSRIYAWFPGYILEKVIFIFYSAIVQHIAQHRCMGFFLALKKTCALLADGAWMIHINVEVVPRIQSSMIVKASTLNFAVSVYITATRLEAGNSANAV